MTRENRGLRLAVSWKKHADGGVTLRCVRPDGTETWQHREGAQGAFFASHDILHFALETELGCEQGFFGLIAAGWSIEETTGKTPKGPLPEQALDVELWVSLFAAEQASGETWTVTQLAEQARLFAQKQEGSQPSAPLVETDVLAAAVRAHFSELHARWLALPRGEVLAAQFGSDANPA